MRIRDLFRDKPRSRELDLAVRAWKSDRLSQDSPGLNESAREEVLRAVLQPVREAKPAPWAPLFVPASRLLAAGAAPAMLLAGLIGYGAQVDRNLDPPPQFARLEVSKAGGDVIFEFQNGGQPHRIYRLEPWDGGSTWELIKTTRGQFRDRLRDQSRLVVYRIE